jgi:sugar lactone lactonase YvrE
MNTKRAGITASVFAAAVAITLIPAPAGATEVDPGPIPGGGNQSPISPTQFYVTDQSPPNWFENGMVLKVDGVTGARTLLSDNATPVGGPSLQSPVAITLDAAGDLLIAESFEIDINGVETPSVIRVNRSTGARTLVSSNAAPNNGPDLVSPSGIAVEASGSILIADPYAFASGNGGVIRVDPVTGVRTTLSRNQAPVGGPSFAYPRDLAVAANGDIYVLDANGVIRVNPVTGVRTLISSNTHPAGGPSYVHTSFLTLDAAGSILVSDWGAQDGGRIMRVDPVTGSRTTVSENAAPVGGPAFQVLGDLVVVCDTIYAVDIGGGAVLRVDPVTGARSTLSSDTVGGGQAFGYPFGIAARRTMPCLQRT